MSKTKRVNKGNSNLSKYDSEKGFVVQDVVQTKKGELKGVIYCRVSSRKQVEEGNGLESQEGACRKYCKSQSPVITIDSVFREEGVSGTKSDREEFNRMVEYLKDRNAKRINITHLIVTEASRISRASDISEALQMEARVKQYGVKIIRLDSTGIDEETDEGELVKTIHYAVASYEVKRIAKRAFNGRIESLEKGGRPFPKPPTGYIREYEGKKYHDIIDEEKGPLIAKGLELYADNIIASDADLRRFWQEQGLSATYNGGKTKLQRTFVEKSLKLVRLLFYTGYIIYPDWWTDNQRFRTNL